MLLVLLLLLPLFVGLRIRRGISQRSQRSKRLRETYGRFFGALRPQAYGWAAAAPISLACLAALSAGLPEHADLQAWLALALLLGGAYARASLKPHIVALHGVVHAWTDVLILVLLALAMIGHAHAQVPPNTRRETNASAIFWAVL